MKCPKYRNRIEKSKSNQSSSTSHWCKRIWMLPSSHPNVPWCAFKLSLQCHWKMSQVLKGPRASKHEARVSRWIAAAWDAPSLNLHSGKRMWNCPQTSQRHNRHSAETLAKHLTEVTVSEECQAYHKAKFQWQDTMDTAGLCPHVLSGSIELKRLSPAARWVTPA